MEKTNLDRNDRAVQIFLNGQFKEMRDNINNGCKLQKVEVSCMPMGDSITIDYNNRAPARINKKNAPNARRLSQIKDQE